MIKLDPSQQWTVDRIRELGPGDTFRLDAAAGSGKTSTMTQEFPEAVFVAPTHKACRVLRSKLPEGAVVVTLASLVSKPLKDVWICTWSCPRNGTSDASHHAQCKHPQGHWEPVFGEQSSAKSTGHMIILDETSMVLDSQFTKLRAMYASEVIVGMGDDFQIPPVITRGSPDVPWHRTHPADSTLSTLHRNTDEVLLLAHEIRNRRSVPDLKDPLWAPFLQPAPRHVLHEDFMAVTPVHGARQVVNSAYRGMQGRGAKLEIGDVLMFRGVRVVLSGVETMKCDLVTVKDIHPARSTHPLPSQCPAKCATRQKVIHATVELSCGTAADICIIEENLTAPRNETVKNKFTESSLWSYAYCVTVNSSQGSQFANVLYVDPYPFVWGARGVDRAKAVYTAITRSSGKLFVDVAASIESKGLWTS